MLERLQLVYSTVSLDRNVVSCWKLNKKIASLQIDGSVLVLVTLEHNTTAKVLTHLAAFSENSLTNAQNMITRFYMKTRLMQKSQGIVIYKFPLQLLLFKM